MKLLRLTLEGRYKELKDQTFDFSSCSGNIIALLGLNGSGKSQLLELIAETFAYLERVARREFRTRMPLGYGVILLYEIKPVIDEEESSTFRITIGKKGAVSSEIFVDGSWDSRSPMAADILPKYIIGYASGLNENLQRGFLKNAVQYFDVMSIRSRRRERLSEEINEKELWRINHYYKARHPGIFDAPNSDIDEEEVLHSLIERDTPAPMCIFLDYDCNALLMASLSLLKPEQLDELFPDIPFRYPKSFTIRYDLRKVPFEEDNIRDVKQLIQVAGEGALEGVSKRTSDDVFDMYELDYLTGQIKLDLSSPEVVERISSTYYNGPLQFFEKLYKIQLLGARQWQPEIKQVLREDSYFGNVKKPLKSRLPLAVTELKLSNGHETADFDDLSDGELQMIQILGATHIFSQASALFLYDEPETHLNPSWRTQFHNYLSKSVVQHVNESPTVQLLVSTHSPFLVSALSQENVFKFEKHEHQMQMLPASSKTYGASFEVLVKEFYGLKTLISQTTIDEILGKLHAKEQTSAEKASWIEKNLGDSVEKAYLIRKLRKNAAAN